MYYLQKCRNILSLFFAVCLLVSLPDTAKAFQNSDKGVVLNAAFLCTEKVYNSELMAPYDVLQHTVFRDKENYINCFVVTPDGKPFITFEGLKIDAHYSFANAPAVDILIIPSTENSMGADLKNKAYMNWIKATAKKAQYVLTVCDGAFPLAASGAIDGRQVTTFPADRDRLQQMFPEVRVLYDYFLVVDGKFITSVGGARSYEPAFYLVEKLYSKAHADKTAKGLVLDWNLAKLPHLVVEQK